MKRLIPLLLCLLSFSSFAQTGFTRNLSIPVTEGNPLEFAWAGGLNFAQFSEIDLNDDNVSDLFVFDRSNNRVLTFLNNGSPGSHCWVYAPEYESHFPVMQGWAFLYDYNCDSRPDIFTVDYFNHGICCYKNNSQPGNISFTLMDSTIQFLCFCPLPINVNILASELLVPDFNDIDNDGDMDILGQQSTCVGTFAYYKNMSMEDYGVCDSLDHFLLETNSWGDFALRSGSYTNVVVGSWNINCYSSGNDHSYEIARRDDTYASIHTIDIDGDHDKDVIVGDSQAYNSLLIINGGDSSNAHMVSQDTLYPSYDLPVRIHSFSAFSFVDADNDGVKDLVFTQSEYENKKGTQFYKNTATNAAPVVDFQEYDFLQNEMIDVGECAAPVLYDYDNDGLKDLLIGNKGLTFNDSTVYAGIALYRNNGTASSPSFIFMTDDYAGIRGVLDSAFYGLFYPAFGDLDGDSDIDLLIGTDDGRLIYFMNSAGPGNIPAYAPPVYFYMSIDVGQAATPQLYDLNQDGMLDLVIGEKNGFLGFYKNVGTTSLPFFSSTPTVDTFGGADVLYHLQTDGGPDGYSVPFLFDQGGETRMLASCMKGFIYLYGNIDGNINGNFTLLDTVFKNVGGSRYGYNLTVSGGDLNNDTLVDMVVGLFGGGPQIFLQDDDPNSIGSVELTLPVSVYPNPANDKLVVKMLQKGLDANCELLDITGRAVLSQHLRENIAVIDVSSIAQGVYFLNITSGRMSAVKKVVIGR